MLRSEAAKLNERLEQVSRSERVALSSQTAFAKETAEMREAHAAEVQASERLRAQLQQTEAAKMQAERGVGTLTSEVSRLKAELAASLSTPVSSERSNELRFKLMEERLEAAGRALMEAEEERHYYVLLYTFDVDDEYDGGS